MTSIMRQTNLKGTRACNATCHGARGRKCACICEGRYHGVGSSEKAQELLTADWLGEKWREKKAAVEAAGGSFERVVCAALQSAITPPAPTATAGKAPLVPAPGAGS